MKVSFVSCWILLTLPLTSSTVAAAPDAAAGEKKAAICVACHGASGNSGNPAVPTLAAQTPMYVYFQLLQFREGRRINEQMSPFAAKLTDADMKDIGAYFAAQKMAAPILAVNDAVVAAGKAVAARNHCGSCHMPDYAGQKHIPRLAGLNAEYLVTQMRGFKTGARQDLDGSMASAAQPLSEKDILDVAGYLAGLH